MAIYPSGGNNFGYGYGYGPYGVGPGNVVPQQIFVDGLEGAKAYQLPCNCRTVLWDSTLPLFYVKQVDAQGRPSIIRTCQYDDFVEKKDPATPPAVDMANYVTIDQLKDYISGVIKELSVGPQGRIVRDDVNP